MKILGRIKKSKVLTAVMTAVLIFQSACPTGLAYAAEQARSSAVLTVTASVDDLDETLPTLKSPTDFTAGSAIGTCPAFWVANDDGTSYVEALMAKKQKQGLALNWYNEETGESFDWYKTKVTDSIHVVGKWEKYDVSVTFSANDGTTKSDTETVPYGQSYKQAFGKEKAAPATRAGYEFAGWYDSTTNKEFDFGKKLTDPTVSVYAKWNLKDAVEVSPSDTARPAQTATGTCSINGTWFGTPFYWGSIARFNLSHFTGELAGATVNDAQCVDSGAENPYLAGRRSATYQATLTSFDETTGKAVYDVYLYPAGHATGDMYVVRPPQDSYHNTQVGVQRMHTTITVYKVVKGYIELQKASTCTNVSDNNKLYSLAGAEFSIYDASGKFVQKLTTNEKGETGRSGLLTAGTYTVKETKAPEGYYAADDFTVKVNAGQVTKKTVGDKPYDDPMYMLVGKFDGEKTYNGAGNLPQGSATLADAEFTVDYYDTFDYDNYDDLKKADIEPTHSWTFKTDEDGFSYFDAEHFVSGDSLIYNGANTPTIPRGTIVVRETKAPKGYLKSNAVSFQKIMEGSDISALKTYNLAEVPEQVYRSDFEFTKKAENGSDRLAGVPFKVTSLTTGESHIAVTDENGYFSSASSWNAHDGNTNANDWALTADGTIDSSKLNASAGFWFGNNTVAGEDGNATTGDALKADNSLGAMPFDTYSVEELRCTANEGYALVNTTVTVSRNGASIDFGTLDDPEPEIHTTAYDASDSDHYIGVGTVKVTDKVEYSHLVAGKTYTVTGEVHDTKTGDVLKVNGKTVTAEKTFTAEESHGSVTVDFSFDSYDLAGKTLVVYETLTDAKGAKLAEHKDKDDVSQQVTVLTPKLSTSAVSEADNSKSVTAEGDATVTDYVRYTGLTAGQTYTLTGTLMDKSTKKAFVNADGNPVTATAEFTAEAESGTATVTFTFDASGIKTGTKLVAFETLSTNGIEIADHKDINDIDQTVTVKAPVIGTTAVDAADGDKTVTGEENVAVRDTVHYNNVTPGKTYKVTGTLYEKVTDKDGKVSKKVFKDKNGNPVTAEANFTAEDSYGNVDVTFYFDGSSLKEGTSLVAFESLSYNDKEIASHADVNDAGQTVTIGKPKLSTSAADALDGDKNLIGEDSATVVDTVHYNNVTPGKTYKVTGTLYEKVTDKDGKVSKKQLLDADGNPVTAETEFVPETSFGDVDVTFTFDASDLKAKDKVVAFESLSLNGKELASHADIEDKSQTVTITKPTLSTTAVDSLDADKNLIGEGDATIVDTVKYKNVTPGKTYKVTGTLYEKVTDKDGKVTKKQLLDADGNPVTAETEFVPEDTYGTVDVTFTFDASDLKAKDKVVAFESLSLNGKELASHADIEDKSQTVTITKPEVGTTAKDGLDGNKTVVSDTEVSVVDTVKYKNVTPGKTYKVSGTLYEKVTDKDGKVTKKQLLDADGNPVTAETEFVPEDTYGTVDVTFTFDGSLLKDNTPVVAFESLSYKDKEIASHSDIEDEDQTVTMHTSEIGTTATDKLDGDKTVIADAESTVTDKVEYDHVLTGKAYTMAGILMDAKTGLPVLTGEGAKKYTEDDLIKFTSGLMNVLGFQSNTYSIKVKDKDWGNGAAIVKNADGSYTYDASERTENEDGTWTVKTDTQTLTEQEDGTWKLTGLEGSGSGTADGGTSFVRNIEETYKADEVEVTDNGIDWSNAKKLPTASIDLAKVKAYAEENKDLLSCLVYKTAEFTPEKESGSIDMDYTFNSNDVIDRLSGETKNLVVFEVMFKGSIENASDETPVSIVASECDKDNEGQTVKLAPSTIGTTATDKSDGDHELMAGKDAVITDEVKYEGLIPGKEYTLHATLMDKKTGEPLKVADKGVTAELKFTPNSESGTVSINLGEFDATSLDGHTLVVFEELTKQSDIDGKTTDVTVAEHKDINDEGQSVTVTSTPAGSTYGKTGVDMTNIAIAIGILLIAAGCATAYGIKSRKTTKGDADESAEDNTKA